jgi:hypothetical protein
LIRYTNYARTLNKKFYVFYLTLNENWTVPFRENNKYNFNSKNLMQNNNPASYVEFISDKKFENCSFYTQITYNKHILNWLDKCKKYETNNELLNNGIEFYINLLNILTNQTMDNKRTNQLISTITENPDYIKIYFEIIDEDFTKNLKIETISKFIEKNTNIKRSSLGWMENRTENYLNIISTNNINLCLSFENYLATFSLGLYSDNEKINREYKKILKDNSILSNLKFDFKKSNWICFKEIKEWENYEWSDLLTNGDISNIFKENFEALKEIINEISN